MTQIQASSNSGFKVCGELTFATALAVRNRGLELLAQADPDFEIDLSGVTRAGSAGVSVLLSWLRFALEREVQIRFSHLPDDLLGVAKVSGADRLLPAA